MLQKSVVKIVIIRRGRGGGEVCCTCLAQYYNDYCPMIIAELLNWQWHSLNYRQDHYHVHLAPRCMGLEFIIITA